MLLTTNLEHRVLNNGNSEETFTSALLVVSNQQHFPIDLLYPFFLKATDTKHVR